MARRQELFEYFKSRNAYTAAQSSSGGGGQSRRRRSVRRRRKPSRRGRSVRALDALRPPLAEFLVGAPWLTASAVLLIAVALVLGSYLLGRDPGTEVTNLSSRAPGASYEEEKNEENVEAAARPAYSILVLTLADSESNTERALDIEGNLIGLDYPAEAVLVPADSEIRIYVGESDNKKDPQLRAWLEHLRDPFEDAKIVER